KLYQEVAGQTHVVSGRYALQGAGQVGFAVDAYDHSTGLVIDPVLSYSTYLGGSGNNSLFGSGDVGNDIAVDSAGSAYLTGSTESINFPTVNPLQSTNKSAGSYTAFVSKLNPSGTALVYSTYLGGSIFDSGYGIVVDGSGSAYITGQTN